MCFVIYALHVKILRRAFVGFIIYFGYFTDKKPTKTDKVNTVDRVINMAINFGKINYFKTCASIKDLPDDKLPEIVLAGRSNVGKSSLVNALGNNRKLARVSQTPGKTQQIIYFDLDGQAILADLPGYGFSKASKAKNSGFSELCDNYFKVRKGIDLVLLLIDIRHEPSNDDIAMLNFLNSANLPYFLVFTKCDKLSAQQVRKQLQMMSTNLDFAEDARVFAVSSSETNPQKSGINDLKQALSDEVCK